MATLCGVTGWSGGRWIGVCVGLMLVMGACSTELSDEIVDLTTTSTSASDTIAPTTSVVTTTSTTALATTTTSTTDAVVDDATFSDDELAAITAVVIEGRLSFLAYAYDPTEENRVRMGRSHTPGMTSAAVDTVGAIYGAGQVVLPAVVDEESTAVLSIERVSDTVAVARSCYVTNGVIQEIDSGTVIDEGIEAALVLFTLVRSGEGWLLDGQKTISITEGARACE